MNYSELTKLYPNFKIPVPKFSEYYIQTLLDANVVTNRPIEQLELLYAEVPEVSKYKMKSLDEILLYFKNNSWDLNTIDYDGLVKKCTYTSLEFNDFKSDKFYVSIDLKEANWQSFKYIFDLKLPLWEEWTKTTFNLHPFISESKSFRQLVFGNTNPKRLQKIQEVMMQNIISYMTTELKEAIVSRKSDELILEFNYLPIVHQFMFENLGKILEYNIHVNYFKVSLEESCGETIKLKHTFTDLKKKSFTTKMISVPGNRYFMHLKTLILKKPVLEKDLYFEQDRRLAQWVIN
jgi:hypothetical protein